MSVFVFERKLSVYKNVGTFAKINVTFIQFPLDLSRKVQ